MRENHLKGDILSDIEKPKSWREICVSIDRKCKTTERRLDQCAILNILGHLGRPVAIVSVIVGMFVYVRGCDERQMQAENQRKAKQYQAWQVIIAAQGKPGDLGRTIALQDLNRDGISLSNVDISKADLPKINLENSILYGANLAEAILVDANFSKAILFKANFTKANLWRANLAGAELAHSILTGAYLRDAKLAGANLFSANLTGADLKNIRNWQNIRGIEYANIYDIQNPPDEFIKWALEKGAVRIEDEKEWEKLVQEKTHHK